MKTRVIGPWAALLFLTVGALTAQVPTASPAAENQVLLTVNGDEVRASDVRFAIQNLMARLQQQGQQLEEQQLFSAATQEVIDTRLLVQEANRLGIKANTEDVASTLERITQQAGGGDALAASLGQMGVTIENFEQMVSDSDLVQQLIATQIEPKVEVTPEEVSEFYAANPEMFETPKQVHARHILFKTEAEATEEANEQARKNAEAARKRALDGEAFAELAKELSEGPSGPSGGDLGFFSAEQMVPEFSKAAFALEAEGISEVVKTQYGYHLIKVEEVREAGVQKLDEIREPLAQMMTRQKIGEQMATLVEGLREKATIEEVASKNPAQPQASEQPAAPQQ